MAGHRLVPLLHHSNPKNTEFPFSAAISILCTLKREGQGWLLGSEHHLSPVNVQTADNKTNDEKHTNIHVSL